MTCLESKLEHVHFRCCVRAYVQDKDNMCFRLVGPLLMTQYESSPVYTVEKNEWTLPADVNEFYLKHIHNPYVTITQTLRHSIVTPAGTRTSLLTHHWLTKDCSSIDNKGEVWQRFDPSEVQAGQGSPKKYVDLDKYAAESPALGAPGTFELVDYEITPCMRKALAELHQTSPFYYRLFLLALQLISKYCVISTESAKELMADMIHVKDGQQFMDTIANHDLMCFYDAVDDFTDESGITVSKGVLVKALVDEWFRNPTRVSMQSRI
jgi:hypothetical protein